ncbi:oligosaccharide flippase family protein [Halobacillus sp. Nhm2S1]|uniref:oligosaccharide flippase family protein n=1 Tax=Halobacillus sp. Nhm2S1 TaxID=2866716 RepID=UPI001C73B4F0|nr:oligosaccharide flippase family protein [Halobacillus sp. Nhm2S1]MBX0357717.1 oligosaccharide flippase family protein [Halobacillus sp. Nhm2S1]
MPKESIGNDAIKLTTSKVVTLIVSFITAMLLSRMLTLKEYGTYSQIQVVVNLTTVIFMLGLPNSINFFLARAETNKEREQFLSVYYTFTTLLSIIVGLFLVYLTPKIVDFFDNKLLNNFIYVLAIFPWARIIISSIENILVVYKKTSLIVWFRVSNSISLLGIILIVHFFNLAFSVYMFLFIIVEALFAIIVYIIVKDLSKRLKVNIDIAYIKKILLFSIPIGLSSIIGTINITLDKLMIGNFLDTEQLAIYTNASREMPVTIIASSLTAVLLPQLVRFLKQKENDKAISIWGNASVLSYSIICIFATMLIIFSPEVITLLYSEKYLPGVPVFIIYSLVLLLRFTYFGMILNALGKTKFILYSSIISLILNIILNYVLFLIFGTIGPAIATLLSQLFVNAIQLIYTSNFIKVSFFRIFPWKVLSMITIINMILGFLFKYIKGYLNINIVYGDILEIVFLGIVWLTVYIFIFAKELKKQWEALNRL